jgi:hypothetical protein
MLKSHYNALYILKNTAVFKGPQWSMDIGRERVET